MHIKKNLAGVTLIELLVYIAIFSGFLTVLSGLFISTLDVQQESVGVSSIEQDAAFLFARLQYDINRANEVVWPQANGETQTSLVLAVDEGILTYQLQNQQLSLALDLLEPQALTSPDIAVVKAEFTRLGNADGLPSIRVVISLSTNDSGNVPQQTRELTYTFGLR